MKKRDILEFMENNGIGEVEEIRSKNKLYIIKFFYDFDEDELKAARAYANDECDDEENGDKWSREYYIPYLNDIASDNVNEIIEEIIDELEINAQYISYDFDEEEEKCEYIAVFSTEDFEIEEVLEDLGI